MLVVIGNVRLKWNSEEQNLRFQLNKIHWSVCEDDFLEIVKIGIGPLSSHTVGHMRAPGDLVAELNQDGLLERVK